MLVGTAVCVQMVFVWEENGVPGGNPLKLKIETFESFLVMQKH